MINIRTALQEALRTLENIHSDPRLEAEILLSDVLNKNRAYLFAHPEQLITPDQLAQFEEFVKQRAQGRPIAYIIGYREFWSLPLKVNESTLIPRHETERLVELALELTPDEPGTAILDLGTGSGAIALALAKERPHWHIDACDFSEQALATAKDNAQSLNISNISFYHSNWFKMLPLKHYQTIVSNPPYITEHDPHLHQGDVRFEPQTALVSGQEGLADLQYIIKHSIDYLLPSGLLLLEHGYDQKSSLRSILKKLGFINIQCWQDIQGHDRVSGGWRPKSTE